MMFLNFFAIFLKNFLDRVGIQVEIFFFLFFVLPQLGLDRNIDRMMFFLIFLLIFLEFSSPGRVGTEFRMKFFFLSFSAYLSPVWIEIMLEWCFLIF